MGFQLQPEDSKRFAVTRLGQHRSRADSSQLESYACHGEEARAKTCSPNARTRSVPRASGFVQTAIAAGDWYESGLCTKAGRSGRRPGPGSVPIDWPMPNNSESDIHRAALGQGSQDRDGRGHCGLGALNCGSTGSSRGSAGNRSPAIEIGSSEKFVGSRRLG